MNSLSTLGVVVLFATGCGASAPKELLNARSAYDRASQGPAARLNPAGLNSAKQTLNVAEHSFNEEGDSQETRDLAYTAERQALTAEAKAASLQSVREQEAIKARMHAAQTAAVRGSAEALSEARTTIGTQAQALKSEQERRLDAERRAAAATAALLGSATVKQETRGIVITLSGSVLFKTNESTLLATAQAKLDNVAKALAEQDPESKLVVEGHADTQGTPEHNLALSQRRAESVRTYLVSKGIASDRIVAEGLGDTRPIADNDSPEGRANNRRVEIVVQPSLD